MEDYIFRLVEAADEIRRHPKLHLLNFGIYEGIDPATVKSLEELHAVKIPDGIKEFYALTNGLQLRWVHREAPGYFPENLPLEATYFGFFDFWEDGIPYSGCINLLPLEEVLGRNWEGTIWNPSHANKTIRHLNTTYDALAFRKSLRVFDLLSNGRAAAFRVDERTQDWNVLNASDDYLDFHWSRPTDFESYLEFILATKGSLDARQQYYLNLDDPRTFVKTTSEDLAARFIPVWDHTASS